ncbi:MAG: hypothetical protein ACXW27_05745 [Allosphingosinicella sp.]
MTRLGRPSVAIAILALAGGVGLSGAASQDWEPGVILSGDWPISTHIGASDDLRKGLDPVPVTGEEIVAEFKRLCLDTKLDSAAHAQAALGSSWRFKRNDIVLKKLTKHGEFTFTDYRSASAITSLWKGEGREALRARPYLAPTRGLIVSGPMFGLKDLHAPQCNLSLRTSGFDDAAPLVAALEQALGAAPAKAVLKSGWADGHWKIAGPPGETRRVSFDVIGMKKDTQLFHITLQTLPPPKP